MPKCLLCLLFDCHSCVYSLYDGNNNQTGQEATCTAVECPELNCEKVIQEEGKCCKSCDISGIAVITACFSFMPMLFYLFADDFLIPIEPDEPVITDRDCVIDGRVYTDLSLVPSTNTSDPCKVCHCCVSSSYRLFLHS